MVAAAALTALIALVVIGASGLRALARRRPDFSDRGSGLSAGDRAVAGRRLARAHPAGARPGLRDRAQDAGSRAQSSPSPASPRSTTARRSPMPASPISCSRTGASAARARICWRCITTSTSARRDRRGAHPGAAAAGDQGIGNAAGFTMQIELRDGSFDLAKLQAVIDAVVGGRPTQSASSVCWLRSAPPRRNTRRGRPREDRGASS